MRTLKRMWLFAAMMCACTLIACSSSDDNGDDDSGPDKTTLIGSEWTCSDYWIDENDGSWWKGECTLTFTSAKRAEEYIEYTSKNYEWSPSKGDHYEFSSGTMTKFYTYSWEGNSIYLTENEDNTITMTLSGNTMTGSDGRTWTMVKNGQGETSVSVGGNPATGIASSVKTPVCKFSLNKQYDNYKIFNHESEFEYSGNKVVRALVSGKWSESYALTYSNEKVTMASRNDTVVFKLNDNGYAINWRMGDNYYMNEYNSDGYITKVTILDGNMYGTIYQMTYSNGNMIYAERKENYSDVTATFKFTYSNEENKNGIYPENCIWNFGHEFVSYLGILGKPCRNLVSQIDFTMKGTSNGSMVFSYSHDNAGNVTSYQYTDDPFYKNVSRRKTSPTFSFEY